MGIVPCAPNGSLYCHRLSHLTGKPSTVSVLSRLVLRCLEDAALDPFFVSLDERLLVLLQRINTAEQSTILDRLVGRTRNQITYVIARHTECVLL